MNLPNQNIPEKEKDKVWAAMVCKAIVSISGNSLLNKQREKFCYDLYNGVFDEADFNYLRKVDQFEYPAKIRFIPIVRNRCDYLKSQETKRPFSYRVITTDKESLRSKEDAKLKTILDTIKQNYMARFNSVMTLVDQIKMAESSLNQTPPEGQQQDPQQILQINDMKRKLQAMVNPAEKELLLTKEDIDRIDKYYKHEYRGFLEVLSEKGLKFLMQEYDFKKIFNDVFEDKIVVDKAYYFADYRPQDPDPVLRKVNPLNLFYSGDDEVDDVSDCEWAMEEHWMTIPQIIDEFKDDITHEHLEYFRTRYNYDYSRYRQQNTYEFGNPGDYNTDSCSFQNTYLYTGSSDSTSRIRVCYCYWQSPRQIKFKRSPNKYNDSIDYIHWLGEDDVFRKEDKMDLRYANDVWQGILLDNNFGIRLRKKEVQLRPIDSYGKTQLPYIGPTFNGINKRPYSIIWATKDLQLLYNLIHYHEELMLALAGTKGTFMDKSQIPDGMSQQEWSYEKKLGTAWIQTVKEGMQRQATFNQFQNYDDTLSPAIQYLDLIKKSIEEMVSSITGVSRQALGQMQAKDLKGVTEASIQQSSIVTEIMFWQHDHYKRKALERIINLCRIAWKKGRRGQIVLGDMGQEIMNIPEGVFSEAEYKVYIADGGRVEKAIADLQTLAIQNHQKGMLSLGQISKLYSVDTLSEIQRSIEEYEKLARERAEATQQGQQQSEERKQQLDLQVEQMAQRQKEVLEKLKISVDQAKLEFEKSIRGKELELKDKEITLRAETDKAKLMTDASIEQQYINEQKRSNNLDFTIKKMQLTLDSLNETLQGLTNNKQSPEKIKD